MASDQDAADWQLVVHDDPETWLQHLLEPTQRCPRLGSLIHHPGFSAAPLDIANMSRSPTNRQPVCKSTPNPNMRASATSHTSTASSSNHLDESGDIFSNSFQEAFNAMFRSQSPDFMDASGSTDSNTKSSNDSFYSFSGEEEQYDDNSPQALISIINDILGPIEQSPTTVQGGNRAGSRINNDPVPDQTQPQQERNQHNQPTTWDLVSDQEDNMREDEWENL